MAMSVSATSPARWHVPHPDSENRMVSGTAAGIAREIGADPLVVRLAFVVLALAGGVGLALYALCWLVFVVAAARSGEVAPDRIPKAGSERLRVAAVGLIVLGALLGLQDTPGFSHAVVWPAALLAAGVVVTVDRAVIGGDAVASGPMPIAGAQGRWSFVRIAAGVVLAGAGVGLVAAANFDIRTAGAALVAVAIALAGVWLIVAPWGSRLIDELGEERRARIRSEERAEMAAHLHDSVLQTLALIQRSADDPRAMVRHARRQERELRTWLYGGTADRSVGRLRAALEATVAEVEAVHGVPVEVVVVGDVDMDDRHEGLLAAIREAVTNASVHSGAARVDVFAEVGEAATEVFVRDTGAGFDLDAVDVDRRGLRDSIVGRIERLGGSATVSSAPGVGTEVELRLPGNGR